MLWLVIVGCVLLLPCGVIYHGDGEARLAQAESIVFDGSLTSSHSMAFRDGSLIGGMQPTRFPDRYISKYGIGTPLLWTLPIWCARGVHAVAGVSYDRLCRFLISFVNPIITVATGLVIYATLRKNHFSSGATFWTLLCWICATSALPYANSAFSEPLCGLLLYVAAFSTLESRRVWHAVGGLALGYAALVKPEFASVCGAVPLCAYAVGRRGPAIVMSLAAIPVGPGIILLTNLAVFGSPSHLSYGEESSRFAAPWGALKGFTYGVDKSILLYNLSLIPSLSGWWSIRYNDRVIGLKPVAWIAAMIWVIFLPLYCSWWAWEGGLCFGPRFFVPLMPLTVVGVALFVDSSPRFGQWQLLPKTLCAAAIFASLPIQLLGFSIHGEEAFAISRQVNRSTLYAAYRLAVLKMERGVFAKEVYSSADFDSSRSAEPSIRFEDRETFRSFRHWPLTLIALRADKDAVDPPPARR